MFWSGEYLLGGMNILGVGLNFPVAVYILHVCSWVFKFYMAVQIFVWVCIFCLVV